MSKRFIAGLVAGVALVAMAAGAGQARAQAADSAGPHGAAGKAAKQEVDLSLILAVDTSGSVNRARFNMQRQGYAAAFRNRKVIEAIRSGMLQSIAVVMFQWTGAVMQATVAPRMEIKDVASGEAFAKQVDSSERELFGGGTSISGAIDFAMGQWVDSPFTSSRRTIDVSGDGSNNVGRPVRMARDEAVAGGAGINGLPIVALEPDLDRYYYDDVIGGPGAFMVPVANYEQFGDAIVKKLVQEIAVLPRRPAPVRYACAGPTLGAVTGVIAKMRQPAGC